MMTAVGGTARGIRPDRVVAAGLLITAWAVTFVAADLGGPAHQAAPKIGTAFLCWRIWSGATWSRNLLIVVSSVSAGLAAGLSAMMVSGASGIVTSKLVMFVLYAGVGALLCAPSVRNLARRKSR